MWEIRWSGLLRTPCGCCVRCVCAQLGFSMETETREAIRALAPSIGRGEVRSASGQSWKSFWYPIIPR